MKLKVALIGALCLGSLLALRLLALPLVRVHPPKPSRSEAISTRAADPVATDSLNAATVARDPFRLTRRPSAVTYDPLRLAEQTAAPTPKPALQLVGIVWEGGGDPTALVEGLPGVEGLRIMKVGDVVAGLRVRSITIDAVRIVGMDTVWVLKVREPWR